MLVVGACVAVSGLTIGRALARAHGSSAPTGMHVVHAVKMPTQGAYVLFRNMIADKSFGKVALAPLANPSATRQVTDLKCDRVYYAAGRGICLTAEGLWPKVSYVAKLFDSRFMVLHEIALSGIPSRTRISADGRWGATTVFVNGDSYAAGNFSTRTNIIDMQTGTIVTDLEKLTVLRDGKRFHNRNFNFWGVTFARDDDHFYATLGSGASTYLVKGSIRTRTMRVIHDHVECPSLSPNGTRVAFKRSLNSHGNWRLYVLDLRTMKETPLAERESIDDQAEWLDNTHVTYWRGNVAWVVPANGSGQPRKLVADASSPVVVRQ